MRKLRITVLWVRRSLGYYHARHGVFAAVVALAAAIICAALLTGESLQRGLRKGVVARLGTIRSAVHMEAGLFPAALARRLPATRAAMLLRGELLSADGAVCADNVQVLGVVPRGEILAEGGGLTHACLNRRAAEALPGDAGAVRFLRPPRYSVEMPLNSGKEARMIRRVFIVSDGRSETDKPVPSDFALRTDAVPPANLFMDYAGLAAAVGENGMANLLISELSPQELERELRAALELEDGGLYLEDGLLKSGRVFVPGAVVEALRQAGMVGAEATFHLADEFLSGTNATPYGFVAAVTPDGGLVPNDLRDNEIVLNAWLADRLGVAKGGRVTLRWRRFEAGGRLAADSREFTVRDVVTMEQASLSRRLMPVFPGLSDVDSCAEWDVGLPMDEDRLNDEGNEAYWRQWRETPKAFISFSSGRNCFGTYFGEAMSVVVDVPDSAVRNALRGMSAGQRGFKVLPVWAEGLAGARGATDFRWLFTGMAFVLVFSALLLAGLVLALSLETRKDEAALLAALGWRRGGMMRLLVAEWAAPLAAGAAVGALLGVGLARVLIWGLERFWGAAFAGMELGFHFSWAASALSALVSVVLVALVLVKSIRRFSGTRPADLWRWRDSADCALASAEGGRGAVLEGVAGGALAAGAFYAMARAGSGVASNGVFFGAGFALMVSMLLFLRRMGQVWAMRTAAVGVSPVMAGVRRALLTPRRSAAVALLLAVGSFLTIGILAMKHDPAAGCEMTWSGSGGFKAIVTSVIALNRESGLTLARRVSGADSGAAVNVVPVRVMEGDEAGCLNMGQPLTPRLIGLDARAMSRARAFEPRDSGGTWTVLENILQDGSIPALAADQAMLQYSLKAKAGVADGAVYEYAEGRGGTVRVRLVGALPVRSGILQGALIIDEKHFVVAFPDAGGYRMWLCGYAPYLMREAALKPTGGNFGQYDHEVMKLRNPEPGVRVETVEERLRLLGSVESAYIDMFLVLGGLGVVLGVAGVGLVILRGVEERRGELALLNAVGVSRGAVVKLLAGEYGILVAGGLVSGILPALVSIQPAVGALHTDFPWRAMTAVIAGMLLCAAFNVWGAALVASRRFGPATLKEEV